MSAPYAIALSAFGLGATGCGSANPPPDVRAGAKLFARSGCVTCHVYGRAGATNLNAPNLTHERRRHRGVRWQIRHLENPQALDPSSPMPHFGALGEKNLRKLAKFLEASDGQIDVRPYIPSL
jgi:mono/diheme cytochrome c family protein